jgi:uncharacterized protein (DUF433 family)
MPNTKDSPRNRAILVLHEAGWTIEEICQVFKLSDRAIRKILVTRLWTRQEARRVEIEALRETLR